MQNKLEGRDVRVIEEGLCGRTTIFEDAYRENRNGLRTLSLVLETHSPLDGAIIMLGTNDCKAYFNLNAYQIAKGMEQCIDKLLTVLPPNKILLISPIHLGDKVWQPEFDPEFSRESVEVSKRLADEYRRLADEKRIHMISASDYANPGETDQEHMTEGGHAALGEAVFRYYTQYIEKR